jgi:hypothetical protein
MSYQQRLFDGFSVTHERGMIGSFQIEDEDIAHFQADDVVVLVVVGTTAGASFKHDPSGDWVRTNKLTAHQVRVADGVMKEEIIEFYNLLGDQLPFTRPGHSTAAAQTAQSAPASSTSGGSTHVDPSVASTGNNAVQDPDDEDTPDDQDFTYEEDTTVGIVVEANPPRDPALAAFLNAETA